MFQDCETEAPGKLQVDPVQKDWPQHGAITFVDYKMRYRKNSPIVLNGLQLNIRGGEKLGIVGRTGSGENRNQFDRNSATIEGITENYTSCLTQIIQRIYIHCPSHLVFSGLVRCPKL